ncbi:hypothetical protein V8B97DRAFT_2020915 [Scleroderma yunnanense]
MPLNCPNPHDVIQPDFASDELTDAHHTLTNRGMPEEYQSYEKQEQAENKDTLSEECKKHKSKFTLVLLDLICLPAKYALKQMESGNYIELFYFTNQGITDAEEVTTTPSDSTFIWKQRDNGTHSLFFEATPHIIQFMKCYQWPQDHTNMFCSFFLNIQSHCWQTLNDPFTKKTPYGFSLTKIEEEVLKCTKDELMQSSFNAEFNKMQAISVVSHSSHTT